MSNEEQKYWQCHNCGATIKSSKEPTECSCNDEVTFYENKTLKFYVDLAREEERKRIVNKYYNLVANIYEKIVIYIPIITSKKLLRILKDFRGEIANG